MSKTQSIGPTYTYEPTDQRHPPLETEWLLTNGTGTFCMGTVTACNTRRYHGLFVAATQPPVGRIVALNSMAENVRFNDMAWDMNTHEFGAGVDFSTFQPTGWRHLVHFAKADSYVTWTYRIGPIEIDRTLRLLWKKHLAVVSYTVRRTRSRRIAMPDSVELIVRPFCAMRDFHHLRNGDHLPGVQLTPSASGCRMESAGVGVHLEADNAPFTPEADWWHNFHYRADRERGQDHRESLLAPGHFSATFDPKQKQTLNIAVGLDAIDWKAALGRDTKRTHLRKIVDAVDKQVRKPSEELAALAVASDDFVVDRTVDGKASTTILAGYPWFSDWGRDTMIALPGCLIATGRFDEAKRTLMTFAAHIRRGLIPNRFDDYGGDPHYNTVDAPLWFVHAATDYLRVSGDKKTWNNGLADACAAILDGFAEGTDFDIAMDTDGLITAGNPSTQLTWMDAARDGVVFTPRYGKAVEINALWYNALASCAELMTGKAAKRYAAMAGKAKRSFTKVFWMEKRGHLADHVIDAYTDPALRPNQTLAVSLPHSPLSKPRQKKLMQAVRDALYTPMGMRTLSPDHPSYRGRYEGTLFDRDGAYHQGTAWPWLIGPFIEGWLRAFDFSAKSRKEAKQMLQPLIDELNHHALGTIHEIYDGDEPQRAQGCIAQAWSVSEVLRAALLIESKK